MRRRLLRMDLPQAVALAILLHLLLLLGEEMVPGILSPWVGSVPEPPPPTPVRFEFVDLPREMREPSAVAADAPASDRDRQASSPRPAQPLPQSAEPVSEGNTSQRVDTLAQLGEGVSQAPAGGDLPGPPAPPQDAAEPRPDAAEVHAEAPAEPDPAGRPLASAAEEAEARKAQAVSDAVRPPGLRELGQRYDNVTAAPQADFGSLSFETRGVDWGAYANRILAIIRARWIERLPQAYYEGLRGRSVLTFKIARDGGISDIVLVNPSGVRPFDKVAEFSLEASSPLPPPPEAWLRLLKDRETVTLGFYYNLRPPDR